MIGDVAACPGRALPVEADDRCAAECKGREDGGRCAPGAGGRGFDSQRDCSDCSHAVAWSLFVRTMVLLNSRAACHCLVFLQPRSRRCTGRLAPGGRLRHSHWCVARRGINGARVALTCGPCCPLNRSCFTPWRTELAAAIGMGVLCFAPCCNRDGYCCMCPAQRADAEEKAQKLLTANGAPKPALKMPPGAGMPRAFSCKRARVGFW
jgi:hypothetical protein